METRPPHLGDPPEAAIDALLEQQARLAGDVIQLRPDTWALHATIPVDGEVIVAEFVREDEARAVLAHLPPNRSDLLPG